MQSNDTRIKRRRSLASKSGFQYFPATPCLLEQIGICSTSYINKRSSLLDKKVEDGVVYDERLRDYQNQDVHFLMHAMYKMIFNEQRTGKTPTTLVTIRELGYTNNIIIAPGSTLYNWKEEYQKWHGGNVLVYSGTIKQRAKMLENFNGTLIMSYGIAKNDEDILMKRKYDAMIVDEVHRLRNFKGMRSKSSPAFAKSIIRLSRRALDGFALSGTPAPNYPYNIFGTLHLLIPTLFKSYYSFADYYFDTDDVIINSMGDSVYQIGDFQSDLKEKEFVQFLEQNSIQRKRKEVMSWLPDIDVQKVHLPVGTRQQKMLDEMHEFFEYKDVVAMNHLDKMIKERQLANDPRLFGFNIKGAKVKWLEQYMEDYPEKTLIVVSPMTSWLKLLAEEIPGSKLLVGGLNPKQKKQIETEFNAGKHPVLLCNIEVAMEGMKLWRADTLIFLDRDLTQSYNEQMGDRLVPITEAIAKEKPHQEIIVLITDTIIERYIDTMLGNKKSKSSIVNDYKNWKG